MYWMWWMNATRKDCKYSLLDEVQCHNKWKLMYVFVCVHVCVCVCHGNTSPINSLKAEDKPEVTRWKVKNICKISEIKWSVSEFYFKVFSFKCWRNKFTAFSFQKIRKITILIFCYLIANDQLKSGIIYKKTEMRAGDDERKINYEWPYMPLGILIA